MPARNSGMTNSARPSEARKETMDQLLNVLTREGVLLKVSVSFWRGCMTSKNAPRARRPRRPQTYGIEARTTTTVPPPISTRLRVI